MSAILKLDMYLNDDNQTDITVLIYQYDYEPGQAPNYKGHPDDWDPGYGSVAYVGSYQIKNPPPGKAVLEEGELDRLEKLIIAHHEED